MGVMSFCVSLGILSDVREKKHTHFSVGIFTQGSSFGFNNNISNFFF